MHEFLYHVIPFAGFVRIGCRNTLIVVEFSQILGFNGFVSRLALGWHLSLFSTRG